MTSIAGLAVAGLFLAGCAGDPVRTSVTSDTSDIARMQEDARHAQEILDQAATSSTTTTTSRAVHQPNWDVEVRPGVTLGEWADQAGNGSSGYSDRDWEAEEMDRRLDQLERQQREQEFRSTMCRLDREAGEYDSVYC